MALSKTTLKSLIAANMASEFGTPEEPDKVDKMAKALADAIVDHFTAAAVVTIDNGGVDDNGDSLVTPTGKVT